jgi:hypothetical protein
MYIPDFNTFPIEVCCWFHGNLFTLLIAEVEKKFFPTLTHQGKEEEDLPGL